MDFIKFMPLAGLRSRRKDQTASRQREIAQMKALPFLYGLFSTAFSAGLAPKTSVHHVVKYCPDVFTETLESTVREVDAGKTFSSALTRFSDEPHLRSLSHVLLESHELGTQTLVALDVLNRESINSIRRQTERSIKKLPITLLFPLVVCILPAFILLGVVPIVMQGLSTLQW